MAPADIASLLEGERRYDPEILPTLVDNLKEQLSTGSYNAEANLSILKMYLLHPSLTDVDVIEKILLKALMAFPAADFSLCLFQIPERYHTNLKDIIGLARQLEMAKFKTFWKEAEDVVLLNEAKGWQDAVRKFIAGVVSATYRSIKKDQLAEILNLQASGLAPLIKERGWTNSKEDKETVIVNTNAFESVVKEPKASTTMALDEYKQLFKAAALNAA